MGHRLIREYYTCFNERRFRDAADFFSDDAIVEHPPFVHGLRGGAAYLKFAEMWVEAFPDGQLTIDRVEQRGDTICEVELIGSGTHRGDLDLGPYGVFKHTGRQATLRFRELLEIRVGKITFASLTFDVHELIRQLTDPH